MADGFRYDVFISHSSKDKPVVRPLAERLRVWLDDWELKPGDNTSHKIEDGLEHSFAILFEGRVPMGGLSSNSLTQNLA